jgi:hypothetical protein
MSNFTPEQQAEIMRRFDAATAPLEELFRLCLKSDDTRDVGELAQVVLHARRSEFIAGLALGEEATT